MPMKSILKHQLPTRNWLDSIRFIWNSPGSHPGCPGLPGRYGGLWCEQSYLPGRGSYLPGPVPWFLTPGSGGEKCSEPMKSRANKNIENIQKHQKSSSLLLQPLLNCLQRSQPVFVWMRWQRWRFVVSWLRITSPAWRSDSTCEGWKINIYEPQRMCW